MLWALRPAVACPWGLSAKTVQRRPPALCSNDATVAGWRGTKSRWASPSRTGSLNPSTAGSATNASMSTCSAACPRPTGSSKHGRATTTRPARTRALRGSPQKPLQPAPHRCKWKTDTAHERGGIRGGAGSHPISQLGYQIAVIARAEGASVAT